LQLEVAEQTLHVHTFGFFFFFKAHFNKAVFKNQELDAHSTGDGVDVPLQMDP